MLEGQGAFQSAIVAPPRDVEGRPCGDVVGRGQFHAATQPGQEVLRFGLSDEKMPTGSSAWLLGCYVDWFSGSLTLTAVDSRGADGLAGHPDVRRFVRPDFIAQATGPQYWCTHFDSSPRAFVGLVVHGGAQVGDVVVRSQAGGPVSVGACSPLLAFPIGRAL